MLIAQRFRVMGEPMRITLLDAPRERGATVNGLVAVTGAGQQNVSKHLLVLHHAGREKEGTSVRNSIVDPSISELCELVCGGLRQQVAELDQILSSGAV